MKILMELFITFARIGLFTFGGGYAMLPMLEKETVENKKWVTEDELIDYFAISQCTPGVIAANVATFIGYRFGLLGAVASVMGVTFPSYVIITIIAAFLNNFQELMIIQNAFAAIRVTVGVLILNAVVKLWKTSVKDNFCAVLVFVAFFVSVIINPSPILIVVTSSLLGLIVPYIKGAGNDV